MALKQMTMTKMCPPSCSVKTVATFEPATR
jgi:hypothetical protein